jgi:hypothetical protein
MSRSATVDRRILRAFYTQYVAVLLILLVFCVGASSSGKPRPREQTQGLVAARSAIVLGTFEYNDIFSSASSAEIKEGPQLKSLIEILQNHDVRAVLKVHASLDSHGVNESTRALERAHALRARLLDGRIPAEAMRILIAHSSSGSSELSIEFQSLEARNEQT